MHVGAAIGERHELGECVGPFGSFKESRVAGLLDIWMGEDMLLGELDPARSRE